MLQWALKYAKLGLSVIPLAPGGKTPTIHWAEYQSKRATEEEIKKWWAAAPNANIGIVTGKISDLVVVDLDGPEGLRSSEGLGLTSSCVSLTGRGKHLWYRHPGGTVANSVKRHPGVDIRADGGYVVAPPSAHPDGRRYRFTQSALNVGSLPTFPSSILTSAETASQAKASKEEGWIAKALGEMTNGNIDVTLFTICSRLRSDGYSADDARILLAPHADRVGATPGHLDEKIENVWNRYEPRNKSELLRPLGNRILQSSIYTSASQLQETGLIIHSPTNPDSWAQFSNRQSEIRNEQDSLKTGYLKLDKMLTGGLKSSRLFTVAARTGVGKTNWLISCARRLCEDGRRVLLFSTEMPYSQIWERYIASLPDSEQFKGHQLYVCDSFAPNIEKVEEAIRQVQPDVFMFDHINHVSEEQHELGSFMQGLNFLRRKYDCAGIVTAQLNRSADWVDLKTGEKVTPRMSMIKGSGTIEQASSRVLLLSETRITPEGTEIVGNLDKNDNGDKGLLHFMLTKAPYRMVEL